MERFLPLVVFDENLAEISHFKDNLEQLKLLKYAFCNDRLVPWFPSTFDAERLELECDKALVRIVDEKDNIFSMPYKFLPVAHRYQLYAKKSQAVLVHTLNWLDQNSGEVSLNLSISDIEN